MMGDFTVFPAIDLRKGQVVRLAQGDPARQSTYYQEPRLAALKWARAGATWLHVVNLDSAFGEAGDANLAALQDLTAVGPQVQFGGGLRALEDVQRVFELGVRRVVLGTAAVENPDLVRTCLERYGPARLAVGIDARQGRVRVRGWAVETSTSPLALAIALHQAGLETVIVTDIARDGIGTGLNIELCLQLSKETALSVIASGGVASLEDIREARTAGLAGVIVGRALYDGRVTLEEALAC